MGNLESRLQKLESSFRGQQKPWLWLLLDVGADKEALKLLEVAAYNARHGTGFSVEDVNWLIFVER